MYPIKVKVHRDKRSLFVRVGWQLYRPVPSKFSVRAGEPAGGATVQSQMVEGAKVNAAPVPGSPLVRIRDDAGRQEWWHSHGPYADELDIRKPPRASGSRRRSRTRSRPSAPPPPRAS